MSSFVLSSDQDRSDSSRQLVVFSAGHGISGEYTEFCGHGDLSQGQKHLAIEKSQENEVLEVPAK